MRRGEATQAPGHGAASRFIRSNVIGLAALVLFVGGYATYASAGPRNSVGSKELKHNAVGKPHIKRNAVAAAELRRNSVRKPHIRHNSVASAELRSGAVRTQHILNGAVGTQKLGEITSLGTSTDNPLELIVDGGRALRLEPASDGTDARPNVVGGAAGNAVLFDAYSATIGGGANNTVGRTTASGWGNEGTVSGGVNNTASGTFGSTVGGGDGNIASGSQSTVGGGTNNTADGNEATVGGGIGNEASGSRATVPGGDNNAASGIGAAVGGGAENWASGNRATVAGGYNNEAAGNYSFVAGGISNEAAGQFSFVAGRQAKNTSAAQPGVFLFADSTPGDFSSNSANEFAVRASGGFRLRTSSNLSTGCNLPSGSGTFSCTSDERTKRDFEAVDPRSVLDRLAELPIQSWRFAGEDQSVRHLGPTAQDFHRAFGLGQDPTSIGLPDANGVALLAIKALERELRAERHLRLSQERRMVALEARLTALERDVR